MHGSATRILFHITDQNGVNGIQKSVWMRRGSSGLVGGGIYFAETIAAAKHKAHSRGLVIKARVFVGKSKLYDGTSQDFNSLYSAGYDSVYCPNGAGTGDPEWVVYNSDQVEILSIETETGQKQVKLSPVVLAKQAPMKAAKAAKDGATKAAKDGAALALATIATAAVLVALASKNNGQLLSARNQRTGRG